MEITIREPALSQGRVCEPILRSLPQWFGIESALLQYVKDIEELPTLIACQNNRAVGFLTLKQHNQYSSEIYVMGVAPEMHRSGVGRGLIIAAEQLLEADGVEYLQVKTLGASHPDSHYRLTRTFYTSMGFKPLEEFNQIWNSIPCLLMVKAL